MNRCHPLWALPPPLSVGLPVPRPSRRLLLAVCLLGAAHWATAQALARNFPPGAERGVLVVVAPPVVQLNGRAERLSPGARIRGVNNLLLMSGALIGQPLQVHFVRNPLGEVHEVWLLSDAEAALPLPTQR